MSFGGKDPISKENKENETKCIKKEFIQPNPNSDKKHRKISKKPYKQL